MNKNFQIVDAILYLTYDGIVWYLSEFMPDKAFELVAKGRWTVE